jgi:lysophospholipase L1-like esterase
MGENGPVFAPDIAALRKALAGVPEVLLLNVRVPRSWQGEVNHILAKTARQWPQAKIVDWHDASANPDLLYDDGIHPNPKGQKVYARLVDKALGLPAVASRPATTATRATPPTPPAHHP